MNTHEIPVKDKRWIGVAGWVPPKEITDMLMKALVMTCDELGNVSPFEVMGYAKNPNVAFARKVLVRVIQKHICYKGRSNKCLAFVSMGGKFPAGWTGLSYAKIAVLTGRSHATYVRMMKKLAKVNPVANRISRKIIDEYNAALSRDGRTTEGENTTQAGRDLGDGLRSVELQGADCFPADPDRQTGEGVQSTGGIARDDQNTSGAIPAEVAGDVVYARGGH